MADEELEGAILPQGIEVDETSAYFGITDSSELINRLAETDRLNGLGEFLSITSDLLLKQANFDFDTAASRLQVEAGEIYWLLSGPFGLLSWTDPIRNFMGMEDSMGNPGGPDPGLATTEKDALDAFNDPFRLLKMLAIGHTCGGLQELDQYLANFEAWMQDVPANKVRFLALHQQISSVLRESNSGGDVSSLSSLTGGPVTKAAVETPTGMASVQAKPEPEPEPEPEPVPEPEISLASAFDAPLSQQEVREAFDEMDANSDGVISEDEFRSSPMVAKLPEPVQKEMFERIDTNKDEVLQYEEFSAAAEHKPSAPFLAPKRAPVVQPVRSPIQQPQSSPVAPVPSPAPMPRPVPEPAQTAQPASSGRHRSGVPGVHHVLQTGIYCGSCNIAVEHHWRHCPICGSRL